MIKVHRIVNSVFNSCTYIVHGEESRQAVIVDCGDVEPIVEYLTVHGLMLSHILLTHTHFDHIYGLNQIVLKFPEAKILTNAFGVESLCSPRLNFSYYHPEFEDFIFCGDKDLIKICSDNERLSICSLEVDVMPTPGHDPSCLSYMIGQHIFTGDSYIPGLKVLATFPKSDKQQAKENEAKLKEIGKEYIIRAGHK